MRSELSQIPNFKVNELVPNVGDPYGSAVNVSAKVTAVFGRASIPLDIYLPLETVDDQLIVRDSDSTDEQMRVESKLPPKFQAALATNLYNIHDTMNRALARFGIQGVSVTAANILGGKFHLALAREAVAAVPTAPALPAAPAQSKPTQESKPLIPAREKVVKYSPGEGPILNQLKEAMGKKLVFEGSVGRQEFVQIAETMLGQFLPPDLDIKNVEVTTLDKGSLSVKAVVYTAVGIGFIKKNVGKAVVLKLTSAGGMVKLNDVQGINAVISGAVKLKGQDIDAEVRKYKQGNLNRLFGDGINNYLGESAIKGIAIDFTESSVDLKVFPSGSSTSR